MINIENWVFTAIYNAVKAVYPDAVILGDYIEELASYPTVTVTEIYNNTLRRMQDEEPVEHYATVTYEVNVYANDRLNKREVCKDILNIIDGVMFGIKFTKSRQRQLPAIDHSRTVFRMYARYTGVVDEGTVTVDEHGEETITYHTYRG